MQKSRFLKNLKFVTDFNGYPKICIEYFVQNKSIKENLYLYACFSI